MTRAIIVALFLLGALSAVLVAPRAEGMAARHVAFDEGKDESGNTDNGDDDNDGENHDKDDDKDKDKDEGKVEAAAPYTVDVECDFNADDDQTTCTFKGEAPEGAKDVSHVDLPEKEICAPVVGGDAERVDPDPNTRVVGYKSRGSEGEFKLVLEGEVTTGGTATYWFKTGDGVFPARGPGLRCGEDAADLPDTTAPAKLTPVATEPAKLGPTPTPAADLSDSSGAIHVEVLECPMESGNADTDWYGLCTVAGSGYRFRLTAVEGTAPGKTAATDAEGQVTFGSLQPGLYDLSSADNAWCHAQSDSVDAEGNVNVVAGERATVWTFYCLGG
jgi:hypothetical protein